MAIGGLGVIAAEDIEPTAFSCGDAIIIPAAVEKFILKPQWQLEFLCASLPVESLGHPKTQDRESMTSQ